MSKPHVTRVKTKGIKAHDIDVQLTPRTLLVGPNKSGKTTAFVGIQVALLGCVPDRGKTPAITGGFVRQSAKRYDAAIEFSNGCQISRGRARKGDAWDEEEVTMMVGGDHARGKPAEIKAAVQAIAGETQTEAYYHLDLRQLVKATDTERAKILTALLDAGAPDKTAMRTRALGLLLCRIAGSDAQFLRSGKVSVAEAAHDSLSDAQKVAVADLSGFPALVESEGIDAAAAKANRKKLDCVARVKELTSAHKVVEDLRVGPTIPSADLQAQLTALATERGKIAGQIQADRDGQEQRERLAARHKAAVTTYADRMPVIGEELAKLVDAAPAVATEVAGAKARKLEADWNAKAKAAGEEASRAEAQLRAFEIPVVTTNENAARLLLASCERDLALANESPWREVDDVAYALDTHFPGDTPDWLSPLIARLYAVAEKHGGGDLVLLQNAERNAAHAFDAAKAADAASAKAADAIKAKRAKIEETAKAKRTAQATHTENARKQAAIALADEKAAKVASEAAGKQAIFVANERARLNAERAAVVAELKAATDARDAITPAKPLDVAALQARLTTIGETETDLRAKLQTSTAREEQSRQMVQSAAELTRQQELQKAWAAAEWACGVLREEDTAARSSGLIAKMQAFLTAAHRPEVPYIRTAKGSVDFGWVLDGESIAVEYLNGGDMPFYCAALLGAILETRGYAGPIMVEAAEMDGRTLAQLLDGCAAFPSVQVLVATWVNPDADLLSLAGDWSVVRFGV